jgi:hypothetical protein
MYNEVSELKHLVETCTDPASANLDCKVSDDLMLVYSNSTENVQANGVIFDKEYNVVCRSQPKFNKTDSLDKIIKEDTIVEYCEDGTVIRLYHHSGTWKTATTKCIDAKESFFTSQKSFDELFWQVFDRTDVGFLDPKFTYIFILIHSENRIVVKHTDNYVIFVSRIHNESGLELDGDVNEPEMVYTRYKRLEKIKCAPGVTVESILKEKQSSDKKGIMVKSINTSIPDRPYYEYSVYNFDEYADIKNVRGNTPNIGKRYITLMRDFDKILKLRKHYPEYIDLFSQINHELFRICNKTYKLYIDSHVRRNITIEKDDKYSYILSRYHKFYKTSGRFLTLDDAISVFYSIPSYNMSNLVYA